MQTDILFSIIALAVIAFVITFDLIRAKQGRSKPKKVEQKSHSTTSAENALKQAQTDVSPKQELPEATTKQAPKNLLSRMKQGLGRTRGQLTDGLSQIFLGKKQIDEELLEDIETQLLTADIGIEATAQLIQSITEKSERNELKDAASVHTLLKQELSDLLNSSQAPLEINTQNQPFVI